MWRNASIATVTVLVGLAIVVLSRLDFLAPYKRVIFARIVPIGIYVGLLAINRSGAAPDHKKKKKRGL